MRDHPQKCTEHPIPYSRGSSPALSSLPGAVPPPPSSLGSSGPLAVGVPVDRACTTGRIRKCRGRPFEWSVATKWSSWLLLEMFKNGIH